MKYGALPSEANPARVPKIKVETNMLTIGAITAQPKPILVCLYLTVISRFARLNASSR